MTRIACVMKSGGDFLPWHVRRLRDQVAFHAPEAEFFCLSDLPIEGVETVPLDGGWPGWWSKMELFRPDVEGAILYFDLDTSLVGDIGDMLTIGETTIMRDVYRKNGLQSSIMYLAERDRAAIWKPWVLHARDWQSRFAKGGDQAFLERFWLNNVNLWQDALPRQVVSYKVDCREGGRIPAGARAVAFHGKPRPWEVGW